MPTASPVILILGAGANIGQAVAKAFVSNGYKVALVARKSNEADNTADILNFKGDFSDPTSVEGVFAKVRSTLGVPSVVVYNGHSHRTCIQRQSISLIPYSRRCNLQ